MEGPSDELMDLMDLIDQIPDPTPQSTQLLMAGPPRYGSLFPDRMGEWRTINKNDIPVMVAWTDHKEGFGLIVLVRTEVSDRLRNYEVNAKEFGFSAREAYEELELYIKGFDPEWKVTLGERSSGKLGFARTNGR